MVMPNLIHPIDVEIEQIDKAETLYDDDFREPIMQAARHVKKTVKGQPKFGSAEELGFTLGGVTENIAGYVLFRYVDLEAQSITLQDNDRITKIGKMDTDVYIIKMEPQGHYPDQGGATLIKAYFADRAPTRGVE